LAPAGSSSRREPARERVRAQQASRALVLLAIIVGEVAFIRWVDFGALFGVQPGWLRKLLAVIFLIATFPVGLAIGWIGIPGRPGRGWVSRSIIDLLFLAAYLLVASFGFGSCLVLWNCSQASGNLNCG
jgi:hypothetical protein